jgi:hypothetical protein
MQIVRSKCDSDCVINLRVLTGFPVFQSETKYVFVRPTALVFLRALFYYIFQCTKIHLSLLQLSVFFISGKNWLATLTILKET